ncbi:hypothetical protein Bpfe_002556, partial [Biomphalaria pfeifferi]
YTFDTKLMGFHKTDKNFNLVLNTLFTVHARSLVECGKKCLATVAVFHTQNSISHVILV